MQPPVFLFAADVQRLKTALEHTNAFLVPGGSGPVPPPAPPPAADSVGFTLTTGEAIGSPRAVMLLGGLLMLFDPSNESNVHRLVGVSQNAAALGGNVTVVQIGSLTSPGAFVADSVYFAGALGVLTSTPPTTNISVKVGVAKDTGTLIVEQVNPVILV